MSDKLITAPTLEPVTAAELRSWLRDVPDDDATLNALISAARDFIERECNIAIMEQTRQLSLDAWPMEHETMGDWEGVREGAFIQGQPREIELPRSPLLSVTSISVYPGSGAAQLVGIDQYYVDTNAEPGRIILNHGAAWPTPGRPGNGIEIIYIAGAEAADDVPPALKIGIKQLAAHYYENREAVGEISLMQAPLSVRSIIRQFRVHP